MNWIDRKKYWTLVGMLLLAATRSWSDLPVQWRTQGWEPESSYCQLYTSKSVVTLKGQVQRVEKVVPLKGMSAGIHFILKTPSETIPVHLGPKDFVEKQPVHLQAGDEVTVIGSRVRCDGKWIVLAAQVERGTETLVLRDLNGRPAWSATPPKP